EGMSTPDYIFRQNGTFFIWFLEEVESKWRNRESGKRRFGPLSILSKRPGQHVPAWTERQKNSSPPLLAGNDAAGPWGQPTAVPLYSGAKRGAFGAHVPRGWTHHHLYF